ncbi:MAG: invasion associated locus B family protein [Rhodospirillaceae bacterium]
MIPFTPFRLSTILLAALLVGSTGTMAVAADASKAKAKTKVLGSFQDWKAFSYEENGQKVCYVSSQPKKISPKGKARGDAYILITHRPAEKSFGVVSITAGYTYKKDSEVQVKIDHNTFKLFTDGDTAWARDESSDKALSSAIKGGKSLVVKGTSARGTKTVDNYSLTGAGPAITAINEACPGKK